MKKSFRLLSQIWNTFQFLVNPQNEFAVGLQFFYHLLYLQPLGSKLRLQVFDYPLFLFNDPLFRIELTLRLRQMIPQHAVLVLLHDRHQFLVATLRAAKFLPQKLIPLIGLLPVLLIFFFHPKDPLIDRLLPRRCKFLLIAFVRVPGPISTKFTESGRVLSLTIRFADRGRILPLTEQLTCFGRNFPFTARLTVPGADPPS